MPQTKTWSSNDNFQSKNEIDICTSALLLFQSKQT